jgi:hypothetical protein
MGVFDSVYFHSNTPFLKRLSRIYSFVLKDWEFQTKDLVNECRTFYINTDNQFIHEGVWLKEFSGSFDLYSNLPYSKSGHWIWIDGVLIIERGMLTKTIIQRVTIQHNSYISFHKFIEPGIPLNSRIYLRGMLEKYETNRNRF